MVRLGDVGVIITGNTPRKSDLKNYETNDIPFYKPGDFIEGRISSLRKAENNISTYAKKSARILPQGSVLVTCIGIIGKIGVIQEESACNQQINAIIPDEIICFNRYLSYAILHINKSLNDIANSAVVPIINKSQFSNIIIPLPPLDIQKKIATALDSANALIEKRKEQIEKLDLLIKSQFIEMFGDPVTNPKGWEESELEDYIIFLTSGSRGWSKYFSCNGEIFITIKNIKNSKLLLKEIQYINPPDTKEAERTRVQQYDLLISITADLGRTAVVTEAVANYGAYINQHISLIRLNREYVNPKYVSYYLESSAGKRQFSKKNQVGVKSGLNFSALKSLVILVPCITLQNQFAEFVEKVEAQKALLQKSLSDMEENYQSLMQKCFKGEIF